MKRWLFFIYGVGSYLLFFAVYVYMAGFIGNFLVPRSIDLAVVRPTAAAVAINLLLLGLFAAQHSIMARPAFKRVWTRVVPPPIERSTYVLVSSLVTILLMWQWCSLDTPVWDVQQPAVRAVLWTLFAIGWLTVPAVSFMINHFDLFGIRQVWHYLRGTECQPLPLRSPLLYRHVRHPLYLGWALLFWATPTMSVGHLLFAGVLTGYMGLAAIVEERDLVAHFGHAYEEYRRRVPMFLPRLKGGAHHDPLVHDSAAARSMKESKTTPV